MVGCTMCHESRSRTNSSPPSTEAAHRPQLPPTSLQVPPPLLLPVSRSQLSGPPPSLLPLGPRLSLLLSIARLPRSHLPDLPPVGCPTATIQGHFAATSSCPNHRHRSCLVAFAFPSIAVIGSSKPPSIYSPQGPAFPKSFSAIAACLPMIGPRVRPIRSGECFCRKRHHRLCQQ